MNDCGITDFGTWLHDYGEDRVFRYYIYKRTFTPYDQEKPSIDESWYEDYHARLGTIIEAFSLPDGDIMLGMQNAEIDNTFIEYVKLSEIRLEYFEDEKNREEYEVNGETYYDFDL